MTVTVICPSCRVPYLRHGWVVRSTNFHHDNNDVCLPCREGLDPDTLQPKKA